jgi:hypothetical protein
VTIVSRKRPWPYNMIVDNTGVMLRPREDGLLVGQRVETMENAVPTDYSYSSQQPFVERTYVFGPLAQGMGQRTQAGLSDRRYYYGLYVDCSIGGQIRKGPYFTMVTPGQTGEIRGMAEMTVGGTRKLLALAGRYCLVRNGDTAGDWGVSKDFGAGRTAVSAVVFKDAGGTYAAYVGLDNGDLWQFSGATDTTTWTQCTLPASGPGAKPAFLEAVGDELWYGAGNKVTKAETDPTQATNWSGWITVGDASHDITYLKQLATQLLIFKANGIYTVNLDGTDLELFPGLRVMPSATNGRGATAWLNSIYAPFGPTLYKVSLGAMADLAPVGPDRLIENAGEVRGTVTCCAGHGAWFMYFGIYNEVSQNSYLLKLGTWTQEGASAGYQFDEVVHGALYKWQTKRITWLSVSDVPGTNPRLYVGFADGAIGWTPLPRNSPDPLTDTNCRFALETGRLYWPKHHAMFQADRKLFKSVSVYGPTLTPTASVRLAYKTALMTTWDALGADFVANGQRVDFPVSTLGRDVEIYVDLLNTVNTETPVLDSLVLHEQVVPAMVMGYDFTVQARNHLVRRDGLVDRRTSQQIRDAMKLAAEGGVLVTVTLPDGTVKSVSINKYAEVMAPTNRSYGLAWDIPVRAVEFRTLASHGTIAGLAVFTIEELAAMAIQDLEGAVIYGAIRQLAGYLVRDSGAFTIDQLDAI